MYELSTSKTSSSKPEGEPDTATKWCLFDLLLLLIMLIISLATAACIFMPAVEQVLPHMSIRSISHIFAFAGH